jgi:hypothetical protein
MRAVVAGGIATFPVGGVAWDYGQYAVGLERLGFEVYYLEDTGLVAYDAPRREYSEDPTYGIGFLQRSLATLSPSLADRWHVRTADGRTYGMDPANLTEIVAGADLFLNVSGLCLLRNEYMRCTCKVLIDTDPGWNHFVNYPRWDAYPGWQGTHGFRGHDHFFTYAERMGKANCALPTLGLSWQPTRPPAVPDCWPQAPAGERWTTVLSWDNYQGPIEHEGMTYGSKEMEFRRVEDLPSRTLASLEVAAGGVRPPCERWRSLGWSVVDSTAISETAESYRDYILGSRGEFSVAKNVYVATRSGWFSCRSVCYLAAARPVVVQDTGFSDLIPTGHGLLAFSTPEEAASEIAAVEADYPAHRNAARELARTHFDAHLVLSEMLNRIGLG